MRTILYALNVPEESADGLVRIEWHCPPATPDEIKAAHPKCGSCRLLMPYKRSDGFYCSNVSDSYDEDGWIEYPEIHYCPHHQPKEQQ